MSLPHRRKIYAACTAALLEETSNPGEGTFDAALTNGLLAIASVAIPGHKSANATGFMPSANQVLDDLVAEFGATSGVLDIPTGEEANDLSNIGILIGLGHELKVPINVAPRGTEADPADPSRKRPGRTAHRR